MARARGTGGRAYITPEAPRPQWVPSFPYSLRLSVAGTISRFVLLTHVRGEEQGGHSAETTLRTYKEQHGIEKNFGLLKDNPIVNALFLKRFERIETLGLILLIALVVGRLI